MRLGRPRGENDRDPVGFTSVLIARESLMNSPPSGRLIGQAGLANARLAGEKEQPAASGQHVFHRRLRFAKFMRAADEAVGIGITSNGTYQGSG